MISHAYDAFAANSEIIKLSAKLHHNGPDITTLRQLANLCELLAIRLESLTDPRLVQASIPPILHRGSYCRSIRKRYKLTQSDVAHIAGLNDNSIRDIESSKHDPLLETMLRMSFALKTPAAKLWPALNSVPGGVG